MLNGCVTTSYFEPEYINVKGDYNYDKLAIVFPEKIENFTRQSIYALNRDSSDIKVAYYINDSKKLFFVISIYCAPTVFENSLMLEFNKYTSSLLSEQLHTGGGVEKIIKYSTEEYIHSKQDSAIEKYLEDKKYVDYFMPVGGFKYKCYNNGHYIESSATQKIVKYAKNGIKLLGLNTTINGNDLRTVFTLFQCGKYFISYRVSSFESEINELNNISIKLMDKYSPVEIVQKQSLKQELGIHIALEMQKDSTYLNVILKGARAKAKWISENVDSLERSSGFPSLYFEAHKASLIAMLKEWEISKHNNSVFDDYLNYLLKVRDNGFINEFISDRYKDILLFPNNIKFDFDSYQNWEKINKPLLKTAYPFNYFYLIGYE